MRLDSTTISLHHDPIDRELIRYGHSKDQPPVLAQLKVMLAALDPLGAPLVTQIVSGNCADDGLYIPAVDQARSVIAKNGLLYIGDSNMEALQSRAHLVAGEDYYLTPLSRKGEQAQLLTELLQPVVDEKPELVQVYRETHHDSDQPKLIAQGYDSTRLQEAVVADKLMQWRERLLVVYSPDLARSAEPGLHTRLQRAEEKLLALTPPPGRSKPHYDQLPPLQADAETILRHHPVSTLPDLTYER